MARKKKDLKDPNTDYLVFGYRVAKSIHVSLKKQLETVLELWNKNLPEDQMPYRLNQLFIKALKRGLSQLENEKKKK